MADERDRKRNHENAEYDGIAGVSCLRQREVDDRCRCGEFDRADQQLARHDRQAWIL
jgi:hypothetical protein